MKFIWTILPIVCSICVEFVYSSLPCCASNALIVTRSYNKVCDNNKELNLNCSSYTHMLSNSLSEYSHFMVRADQNGEYLDAYGLGFIARAPYFCIGRTKTLLNEPPEDVALACHANRIWYSDLADQERPPSAPLYDRILPFLCEILNLFSAVTLAITAFVYAFLRDLRDSQGTCTFHFVLITGLLHASFFYFLALNRDGILPNLCITNLYLQVYILLSSFTWCSIMGYNSWAHVKNVQPNIDEDTLLKWYRYVGYGLPLSVVLICNMYAHGVRLYRDFRMEMDCTSHQTGVLFVSVVLPILTASLANCFFFVDVQRHLWNSPALELRSEKSTLRKLKYRLFLNGKLFLILGLSWLSLFLFTGIYKIFSLTSTYVIYSLYFLILLVSGQGIFIFLLLVCFRKRVIRSVSRTWLKPFKIFPTTWRNVVDSETAEDSVDDTIGQSISALEKENVISHPESNDSESKDKTLSNVGSMFA